VIIAKVVFRGRGLCGRLRSSSLVGMSLGSAGSRGAVEVVCGVIESVHCDQTSTGVRRGSDDPLKCVE
jgi:hypothetical protein